MRARVCGVSKTDSGAQKEGGHPGSRTDQHGGRVTQDSQGGSTAEFQFPLRENSQPLLGPHTWLCNSVHRDVTTQHLPGERRRAVSGDMVLPCLPHPHLPHHSGSRGLRAELEDRLFPSCPVPGGTGWGGRFSPGWPGGQACGLVLPRPLPSRPAWSWSLALTALSRTLTPPLGGGGDAVESHVGSGGYGAGHMASSCFRTGSCVLETMSRLQTSPTPRGLSQPHCTGRETEWGAKGLAVKTVLTCP